MNYLIGNQKNISKRDYLNYQKKQFKKKSPLSTKPHDRYQQEEEEYVRVIKKKSIDGTNKYMYIFIAFVIMSLGVYYIMKKRS